MGALPCNDDFHFLSAYPPHAKDQQMRALARLAVTTLVVAAPLAAATLSTTANAADDPTPITVVTSDFEDGTVQGWVGRSAETLAHSTTVAHGGIGSLEVTGRTAAWQGPSLDVLD